MTPRARRNGVLSETVEDEMIVYDSDRARAHRLNRTAAIVWRHADGERTVADHAAVLRRELDPAADEDLVWCAIDRLNAARLLEDQQTRSAELIRASRRRFVRKAALVGSMTLLLPVVASITAPTPADAASQR